MKIRWLGTAAAEGWPALFCQCEACREAARRGGRNIRTRSGALIDGVLLIDLNPDLLCQKQRLDLDLGLVKDAIITHAHSDHLAPMTLGLMYPVMAHRLSPENIRVHGSAKALSLLNDHGGHVDLIAHENGTAFQTAEHTVTPLPAVHGAPGLDAQIYLIERNGASLLYAHDTDLFCEEAWAILERSVKKPLSVASLDCTNGPLPHENYRGHMGFEQDLWIRGELLRRGLADEATVFVCNHFSHNGHVLYEEASAQMEPQGVLVAYDGMEITVEEGR